MKTPLRTDCYFLWQLTKLILKLRAERLTLQTDNISFKNMEFNILYIYAQD